MFFFMGGFERIIYELWWWWCSCSVVLHFFTVLSEVGKVHQHRLSTAIDALQTNLSQAGVQLPLMTAPGRNAEGELVDR